MAAGSAIICLRVASRSVLVFIPTQSEASLHPQGVATGLDRAIETGIGCHPCPVLPGDRIPLMTLRDQTFDTFVIGPSNRFAHAAALAVAEAPGKAYNPLYVWGGAGLGKTHLLRGIGRFAKWFQPTTEVEYVSAAVLRRDLVASQSSGRAKLDFEQRYGKVDILLIDDVQRLLGSDAIQTALMELVLEPFCRDGHQVVLTSDRAPTGFRSFRELHLVAEWAQIVDIAPPETETLLAILHNQDGEPFPDDVMDLLVHRNSVNVQTLLDDYAVVCDYATTVGKPVTIGVAWRALGKQ
jgi:chromosomal replication initiator protein